METQVQEQPEEQKARDGWQKLHSTVRHLWRREVPLILQMNAVECGAACLAMILSYYGRKIALSEIRDRCGVGRDGLSALSIARVAQDYGLRVRAVALQSNDFRFVHLPAIIHWKFDHFLVVERWSARSVKVVDPALGRRNIPSEEFNNSFTGVVLMLEPGIHFRRQRAASAVNVRSYLRNYIRLAPWTLVQIVGASLLLQLFGLSVPLLTKIVVDRVLPAHIQSAVSLLGLGIVILLLSQLVMTLLRSCLLVYLQAHVDLHMMLSFFEHLLTLPLRFFEQRANGDILTRLNSNTMIRDALSNQLISAVLDGSFVSIYLLILFWQSSLFGLLVLAIGLLQVALLVGVDRPVREFAMRELEAQGSAQGYVAEALVGIVSLKAAGAERRALQHWSNLFVSQLNASVYRNLLTACIDTVMALLQLFSPLALLWIGMIQVLDGSMEVGTMLALNALAISFLVPLSSLVRNGQRIQQVRSHLERLSDVMEARPEQDVLQVSQAPTLRGRIELKDICFRYTTYSVEILKNISIAIEAGQKIAIVGHTGSGKSTLGKLLLGLYAPTKGEILYDGQRLEDLNYQSIRAQFGVVMQEASVFSGTIRQNIAFNDPDMDMERVVQAAKLAAIHEDIQAMPMGYETFISEQGSTLSGGQRQRVALARALAHSPVILLLDEATSSLDVVTEHTIEQNIRTLTSTQIIIAHRLSTIRNADLILVLEHGSIVERGTHQELLERHGHYAKLVQDQFAHEEAKADSVANASERSLS